MNINDFNYKLPQNLIAQEPPAKREEARLIVSSGDMIFHKTFNNCIDYINEGDLLVLNNTRVIPARLYGKKIPTGAKIELLLLEEIENKTWRCMTKPAKRLKTGDKLLLKDSLMEGTITGKEEGGIRLIKFQEKNYWEKILKTGEVPLPPYIKKNLDDKERYQTIYSRISGSVAAPTAGLHFTESLLKKLREKGVTIAKLTLHVGPGTFRPVQCEKIEEHKMHKEFAFITEEEAEKINYIRSRGGKIIAVGTTSVRTLETGADEKGIIRPIKQKTDKFIYPGYKFKAVDAIITNFHLPKSTLFMLVCAFTGIKKAHEIYQKAIEQKYRFYSFGDACFLLKN